MLPVRRIFASAGHEESVGRHLSTICAYSPGQNQDPNRADVTLSAPRLVHCQLRTVRMSGTSTTSTLGALVQLGPCLLRIFV